MASFVSLFNSITQSTSEALITSSAGTFTLDVVSVEQHSSTLRVTENPVESGASVADHAVLEPKAITINGLVVGYTPPIKPLSQLTEAVGRLAYSLPIKVSGITAQAEATINKLSSVFTVDATQRPRGIADFLPDYGKSVFDNAASRRISGVYERLLALQKSGELLTLHTSSHRYKNMLLVSVQMNQQTTMSAEFSLNFREVFIVHTGTTRSVTALARQRKTQNLGKTQPQKASLSMPRSVAGAAALHRR